MNGVFSGMRISASGLSANRMQIDIVSSNVANMNTTRTEEGGAYRRKIVTFSENYDTKLGLLGVKTVGIENDESPLVREYNPNHPDADETGYVEKPNVDILTEIADMMTSSRGYESNLDMLNAQKSMVSKALEIGR